MRLKFKDLPEQDQGVIAGMIYKLDRGDEEDFVPFEELPLDEQKKIIRKVFEHSESRPMFICGKKEIKQ